MTQPSKLALEDLIRNTDSLTFLNALKSQVSELKEELTIIDETREYQNQAVERARKIIRRIDNQYRAVIKCTAKVYNPPEVAINLSPELPEEDEDDE